MNDGPDMRLSAGPRYPPQSGGSPRGSDDAPHPQSDAAVAWTMMRSRTELEKAPSQACSWMAGTAGYLLTLLPYYEYLMTRPLPVPALGSCLVG